MMGESNTIRVLLVDDNLTMLWGLGKLIQGEWPRMTLAGKVRTPGEAMVHAASHPHVILLDLDLGGCSSIEILPELLRRSGARVLIYTGLRDRRLHEDAMLLGARGVVEKGEPADIILEAIACVHAGDYWNLGDVALELPRPVQPAPAVNGAVRRIASLTPSERTVIAGVVSNWRARNQTGNPPCLSEAPPLDELMSIYSKLGLRNRAELFLFATRHGLAGAPA